MIKRLTKKKEDTVAVQHDFYAMRFFFPSCPGQYVEFSVSVVYLSSVCHHIDLEFNFNVVNDYLFIFFFGGCTVHSNSVLV